MDYREERELLARYWAGETSLEEEERLRDFFSRSPEGMDRELREAAPLFEFLRSEAFRTPDPGIAWRSFTPGGKIRPAGYRLKLSWEYAAILVLMIGSIWLMRPAGPVRPVALGARMDTFQNPDQAMAATREALQILASNLNKGKEQIKKITVFNEAEQAIREQR